ncbi:MAG: LptA/OstA family protein, partial [Xanthomonadales bacterium]|nr:LptA/OstA family protein [Xanthomonadales bacterium]
LALVFLLLPAPAASKAFRISGEDIVVLWAETAWEDEAADVMHFSGGFEMRVRDWVLVSDRATVRGPLEDPEIIEVQGSPAQLVLARGTEERPEPVTAQALRIVYTRDSERVLLDGAAVLVQGQTTLHSDSIEYELDTDRLHASGGTAVRIDLSELEPGSEQPEHRSTPVP